MNVKSTKHATALLMLVAMLSAWASAFGQGGTQPSAAQAAEKPEPEWHPWSESTDQVRIPTSVLARVNTPPHYSSGQGRSVWTTAVFLVEEEARTMGGDETYRLFIQRITDADASAPFIDVPKQILKAIHILGLLDEGAVSPDVVGLFGLSVPERSGLRDLFNELKTKFEATERDHFGRPDPTKLRLVLQAFPKETAALQSEWLEKLTRLIGPSRAELLTRAIRTPPERFPSNIRRDPTGGASFLPTAFAYEGPSWLLRGTNELAIDVSFEQDPIGLPGRGLTTRFRYVDGRGATFNMTSSGSIPERWRHLITPAMISPTNAPPAIVP